MDKNLHDIDLYFKEALDDYEEKPDRLTWQKLNADLDKEEAVFFKRKYSNIRKTVAVLFLLILALILFEFYDLKNNALSGNNKITKQAGGKGSEPFQEVVKADHFTTVPKSINKFTERQASENRFSKTKDMLRDESKIKSSEPVIATLSFMNSKNPFLLNEMITADKKIESAKHSVKAVEASASMPRLPSTIHGYSLKDLPCCSDLFSDRITSMQPTRRSGLSQWSLTGIFSGEISDYILEDDSKTASANESKKSIVDKERHDLSFSTGITIDKKINKQWNLGTGLLFSSSVIMVSPEIVFAVQKPSGDIAYRMNVSSGYVYLKPGFSAAPSVGDSLVTTGAQHNLRFLSIPLTLHFNKQINRFGFSAGGGLAVNALLSANLKTELSNAVGSEEFFSKLEGMRSAYLGVVINSAFNYQLTKNMSLSLMPIYRQAITPINKNSVVKTYPYSYGIAGGLTWRL